MLRASRAALVQAHIENCPACATKKAEAARLQDALDQLRVSTVHMQTPAGVERNLLGAFREEAARRHSAVGRVFAWRLVWLSATALALITAGVQLYSNLRPHFLAKSESNRNGSEVVIQPPSTPGLSGSAVEVFNENRRAADEDIATSSRHHVAKVRKARTEPGVEQALIPASDELSLNGGGSIVRVTLPFSSLVAMGLPVRPDLSDSRVTADVWMDPFGAVMGIRLVAAKATMD